MSTVNDEGKIFEVPATLKNRCMRVHGWTVEFTEKALIGYRQFMKLKLQQEDWDATVLSPPLTVDLVWHQHILDVGNYVRACQDYACHLIEHNPGGGLDPEARKERIKATKLSLKALFGKSSDAKVWSFVGEERGNELVPQIDQPQEQHKRRRLSPSLEEPGVSIHSITIRVRDLTGEETFFKIRPYTQLGKVFNTYAQRKGVPPEIINFIFQGKLLGPTDTPMSLELGDEDRIDCIMKLSGC